YLTQLGMEELTSHLESLGQTPPSYRPPSKISETTISHHSLGIRDAGIAAIVGARVNHLSLISWMDDGLIRSLSKKGSVNWPMEPDGVVVLEYGSLRRVFFIEVDRGSESGASDRDNSWKTKMLKYKQYFAYL